MKKLLALLLAMCMVFALCACGAKEEAPAAAPAAPAEAPEASEEFSWANADPIKIKFAHGYAGGELAVELVDEWMKLVTEKSEGKITWDYYPGGSMGTITELLEQTDLGAIDCTLTDTSQLENFCDEYAILFYPFLMQSYEHQQAVFASDIMDKFGEALSEVSNLHVVGYYVNGVRNICTKMEISNLEECKGVILRVPEIQVYKDVATLLGMSPTVVSYSEVYTAMSTGVCDGMECPNNSIYPGGFHEVGPYILKSGHMFSSCALEFNTNAWSKLPAEAQDLLTETFNSLTAAHAEKVIAADEDYYAKYEADGATVSEWDDPAEPAAACEAYWADAAAKLGANGTEIVNEIIALRS